MGFTPCKAEQRGDDDMRVDPSDVTTVFHSFMFVSSPHLIINYIYQLNYSIIDPMDHPGFETLPYYWLGHFSTV